MKGFLIGGSHSGCGKTTVTLALLQALVNRGLDIASFKCGPDYIDPMFHSRVTGADCYNLDSYFCDDDTLRYLYALHSKGKEAAVIEGVMGYYDGGKGSAYSLAAALGVPAVIVIDCKGAGESVGAMVKGFLEYKRPSGIAGFIFNRLSDRQVSRTREICDELGTRFLGYLPPIPDCAIESRHLGLITAAEIPNLREKLAILADYAERCVDIDGLLALGGEYSECNANFTPPPLPKLELKTPPVIAIARDEAFCFIYRDNLELLERLGCELRFFSPLYDKALPKGAGGLILCGGYPELYADKLSENAAMREEIRAAISAGMPAIAECGGFLYLNRTMEAEKGERLPMVGAIDGEAFRCDRLKRFGYATLTANSDNLLCGKGESFPVHEFHYWDSTNCGGCFTAEKPNGATWKCGVCSDSLYAGFPHLYFYASPGLAVNFIKKCAEWR